MKSEIYRIVFEDDSIVVIEKKASFLSQRSDHARSGEGLYEFISRHHGLTLFPVHRLDREVLGLMIFGKSRRVAERLSEEFRHRRVEKGYEAWVSGRVSSDEASLVHYLKKNPRTNY